MKRSVKWMAIGGAVLALGGAGAAMLATGVPFGRAVAPKAVASDIETARYVSLDKLIVMLKGDGTVRPRYMSVDLVFTASSESAEKRVRDRLPLLRALSYRALSQYTAAEIVQMRPDDMSARLKDAFSTAFGNEESRPFADVLVVKVMVD